MVLSGIPDIILNNASAASIIANLQSIYDFYSGFGERVCALTMTPWKGSSAYTSGKETTRQTVNAWILANAAHSVNLDPLLGDGTSPPALSAAYDSGDHLHPSIAGGGVIATAARTLL